MQGHQGRYKTAEFWKQNPVWWVLACTKVIKREMFGDRNYSMFMFQSTPPSLRNWVVEMYISCFKPVKCTISCSLSMYSLFFISRWQPAADWLPLWMKCLWFLPRCNSGVQVSSVCVSFQREGHFTPKTQSPLREKCWATAHLSFNQFCCEADD